MLIRWKSGYVAYWVRGFYYVVLGAAAGGVGAYLVASLAGGYDVVRHKYSTIAAICFIANLPFALRRRRWWLRFGHQARWLKAHWFLGAAGLTLVFIHSALRPVSAGGWMAIAFASSVALTGVVTHLTRRYARRYALRTHLIAVVLVIGGLVVHGRLKLSHPAFPLTLESSAVGGAHNVPCMECHAVRNDYRDYRCTSCHVHDTDQIRSKHAVNAVRESGRCLDCHPVEWRGDSFSTGSLRNVAPGVFQFQDGSPAASDRSSR